MNVSRREFFAFLGAGTAAAALPGCCLPKCGPKRVNAKIALQLYSLNSYIAQKGSDKGVDLATALNNVAAIGYKGVEFFGGGCFGHDSKEVRKMLADAGLVACGTHVGNGDYGFNTKDWTINADKMKQTCEYNLGYGNNLIICPGGGNVPPGIQWSTGQGGSESKPTPEIDEFTKRLADLYNQGADLAAKLGCRIGLHNHTWEHGVKMMDGSSFWDYFFSHTSENVCMEQDVGWTTCAGDTFPGLNPMDQYKKYPHRSPTLHAKENGMGKGVVKFDAILGKPGCDENGNPCATPVDWDALIPVTEKDGVEWYVVECEKHSEDLSAVLPSYNFLRTKGLN